jgi:hypothetical protein
MKGYLARKRVEKMLLVKRTDALSEYWSRINKIMLGNFQRRVRRAYLNYKVRK